MSGPGYNGPPSESRRLRQEAGKMAKHIAELEAGGTAYDAGYQAAKADMEERVYRAEAERDACLNVINLRTQEVVDLKADLAERDDFIDSLHSESGIPTRHWRDRITQYVSDLRVRAEEGGE